MPDDELTKSIIELRSARGGFNINEVIEYKIREELQKKDAPREKLLKQSESFKNGAARRQLDNAVIHIYRQEFTLDEVRELVRFYKTSAGQKMAREFPVIMLKSQKAAEVIQKNLEK